MCVQDHYSATFLCFSQSAFSLSSTPTPVSLHPSAPALQETRLYGFECLLPESWAAIFPRAWGRSVGSLTCYKGYESQAFQQRVTGKLQWLWVVWTGCSRGLLYGGPSARRHFKELLNEIPWCEHLWREERVPFFRHLSVCCLTGVCRRVSQDCAVVEYWAVFQAEGCIRHPSGSC